MLLGNQLQFLRRAEKSAKATRDKEDSFRESEQERTGDAWASGGEEGRGKLRKGAGIRKQELIRACPNGGTRPVEDRSLTYSQGKRRELKHLSTCRKRKKASMSGVVASEKEIAQTGEFTDFPGL